MLLLTGIALLLLPCFYIAGSLFLEQKINRFNTLLQHLTNLWVGLLLVVAVYALSKTGLVSILFLLPVILLFFRKKLIIPQASKSVSIFTFLGGLLILYLVVFMAQVNFNPGVFYNPVGYLKAVNVHASEVYIYSTLVSILHYDGVETSTHEAFLTGFSGVSVYHYFEFWLCSLLKTIYNFKSDLVLFYFAAPLFKTLCLLSVILIFAQALHNRFSFWLAAFLIVVTAFFGVQGLLNPYVKVLIKEAVYTPLLLLAGYCFKEQRYPAALAWLMVLAVANVLFIPLVFLFLLFSLRRREKPEWPAAAGFILLYLLFYFFFKETQPLKYAMHPFRLPDLRLQKTLWAIKLDTLFKVIFTLNSVLVVAYFMLRSRLRRDSWYRDISFYLLLAYLLFHVAHIFLIGYTIEARQFSSAAKILSRVAFILLAAELLTLRYVNLSLLCMVAFISFKNPFKRLRIIDDYDFKTEQNLRALSGNRRVTGLYIHENAELKNVWASGHYPTFPIRYARANDFRMLLFNYDIKKLRASVKKLHVPEDETVLLQFLQPLFPENITVWSAIKDHNLNQVWVHQHSDYLKDFRHLKPALKTGVFYIYNVSAANAPQ